MLNQDAPTAPELREDEIQEMLLLAARLREAHGGELDDSAIQAVSEATGAPADYVRIALQSVENKKKIGRVSKWRSLYLSFDPDVRRYVVGAWLGCIAGFLNAVGGTFGDRSSFLGIVTVISILGALWNCGQARSSRTAATAGAAFGGVWFIAHAAFLMIFSFFPMLDTPRGPFAAFLLLFVAGGALAGGSARRLLDTYMKKVGITDAASERQQLLQQLVELQDKLRTGEQSMTFLSIDVVGSTRMKENAEQLQVEYTFSEYHRYVETVIKRYGGRVHSTAGDGVTCAFEEPAQAFKAGRNIQAGLIELNTHRNKLDTPIRLRIGMHTGTVIAPTQDIQSLNFAHVIDIAAHLQKVCPVGGLAVSDSSAIFLPGGKSGIGDMRVEALDVGASVWQPRTAVTTLTAAPGPANA